MSSDCPRSIDDIVNRVETLQAEREETYRLYSEGFQAYLAAAPRLNGEIFTLLVREVTRTFKDISDEMKAIMDELRDVHHRQDLVDVLEDVQQAEKTKLNLCAQIQITEQKQVLARFTQPNSHHKCDHAGEEEDANDAAADSETATPDQRCENAALASQLDQLKCDYAETMDECVSALRDFRIEALE